MTSCTGSVLGGFGGFEKSQGLSFSVRRRRLTFGARWGLAAGVAHGGGADGEVSIERSVYHSPYVEKPLNSTVIKFRT